MNSRIKFWRDMHTEALDELHQAENRFNHVDPRDTAAIDATIYSMNSAEMIIDVALRQLKQIQGETKLCHA